MDHFIPLSIPNFQGRELEYVTQALRDQWVSTAGGYIIDFEKRIAEYVKVKYAVACQNGTAGLHAALIVAGVKQGDEVIVPTLTFIAPVNSIRYVGAEPVFMDCDDSLNLDMEKLSDFLREECVRTNDGVKNKKTGRPVRAVLPVHVFGNPANMEALMGLCEEYGLKAIEDATESLGSYYQAGGLAGRFTGTVADLGVFSFNGNKIITTGGGGMVVTDNEEYAKRLRYLTTQAKDDDIRYIHNHVGYNYRMTNLQAALGLAQLEQLEDFIKVKSRNYHSYKKQLDGIPGLALLEFDAHCRPNYWFYSLLVDPQRFGIDRERLMNRLAERKIQSRPIWFLNHRQKPYVRSQAYRIEKAAYYWERVLNLPCSSNLSEEDVKWVVRCIAESGGSE